MTTTLKFSYWSMIREKTLPSSLQAMIIVQSQFQSSNIKELSLSETCQLYSVFKSSKRHRLLTNRITLPPTPALTKAGTIQHVSLFVAFVECVIHIVSDAIDDALICLGNSGMGGEFLSFTDGIKEATSKHIIPST